MKNHNGEIGIPEVIEGMKFGRDRERTRILKIIDEYNKEFGVCEGVKLTCEDLKEKINETNPI